MRKKVYTPIAENVATYQELYSIFARLYLNCRRICRNHGYQKKI
jgi:gluconokinase